MLLRYIVKVFLMPCVIIVFFDLPVVTIENKREYTRFRKYLIKSGFIMMQESVYCKMVLNQTAVTNMVNNIRKNKPEKGLVQILTITEKQFSKIEFVTGEYESDVLQSDERLVIF